MRNVIITVLAFLFFLNQKESFGVEQPILQDDDIVSVEPPKKMNSSSKSGVDDWEDVPIVKAGPKKTDISNEKDKNEFDLEKQEFKAFDEAFEAAPDAKPSSNITLLDSDSKYRHVKFDDENQASDSCFNQKDENGNNWATGPIRTQGGGWIWFRGVGEGADENVSKILSEGQALELLNLECSGIPLKSVFIERCISKKGKATYHSRVNVRAQDCKKGVVQNQEHLKTFQAYSTLMSQARGECSVGAFLACYDKATLLLSKDSNSSQGKKMLEFLCLNKFKTACVELSSHSSSKFEQLKYLQIACGNVYPESCNSLGVLLFQENKILDSIYYFTKSCNFKIREACHNLALANYQQGNIGKAKSGFLELCKKGMRESCQTSVFLLFEKEEYKKISELILNNIKEDDRSPEMNMALGVSLYHMKNYKSSRKALSPSCNFHENKMACKFLALTSYELKDFKEAYEIGQKSCDFGDVDSCSNSCVSLANLKTTSAYDLIKCAKKACTKGDERGCEMAEKMKAIR